jgi:hypothetical protein
MMVRDAGRAVKSAILKFGLSMGSGFPIRNSKVAIKNTNDSLCFRPGKG